MSNYSQPIDTQDSDLADVQSPEKARELSESTSLTPQIEEASDSRYQDVETSALQDVKTLDTKQSTLRLETGLSDRLHALCRSEGICREVLLEAMFEHLEANPNLQRAILSVAAEKNEHRQYIANLKRAQSMMKRLNGNR
ncbi:hypothetical protein [Halomicronema sp. CCY15110]|uniref:hypothetical protein n=1 Tax=Halomicronema sp. CCY15110 TaxID=2767773 RepID=UPI001EF1B4C0|nr:hypothetical protein [Halomicronema sp. CCY15110]